MYSRVYLKPVQEGNHKYFQMRSEFNLVNIDAKDYLMYTMDPVKSK